MDRASSVDAVRRGLPPGAVVIEPVRRLRIGSAGPASLSSSCHGKAESASNHPTGWSAERRNHVMQAWSRVALALWVLVAGATGARLTPLVRTTEAGQRSYDSTFPLSLRLTSDVAPTCRHSDALQAAHHAKADDALPARHRKLTSKRFRQRFGALASGAPPCTELLLAGVVATHQIATLDVPVPYRDRARAPPASHQPA